MDAIFYVIIPIFYVMSANFYVISLRNYLIHTILRFSYSETRLLKAKLWSPIMSS